MEPHCSRHVRAASYLLLDADVIFMFVSATALFPARLPDDMDLTNRFEEANAYASVNVNTLEPHKLYPITRAKRIPTKYGLSVVLTLRNLETNIVQVFLPKRYSDVVSDSDIDDIPKQSHCISCSRWYVNPPNPTSCPLNLKYILSPHTQSRHETSRKILRSTLRYR